jgi:uncharacterized protein (TIGR02453 family)
MASGVITPDLFRFLRSLARNNNRDWFQKNKQRYLDDLRDPLCAFIEAAGPKLRAIHPDVIADSRPIGGSLFRIYRDTRFSKDKSPYKTAGGIFFRLAPKNVSAPGFYLHVEPGRVFAAAGMWHPDSDSLRALRDRIVADPAGWKRARKVGLDDGHELKRPPRGFDPDHPLIEDLKRKSFTSTQDFTEKQACAVDFLTRFTQACRKRRPLVAFLGEAVGL